MEKEVTPNVKAPVAAPKSKVATNTPAKQSTVNSPDKNKKIAPKTEENPQGQQNQRTSASRKPQYKSIGRMNLARFIRENIPDYMIPTKRVAPIMGFIFLAVIIIALLTVPYGKILEGDLEIKVGLPMTFLDFGIENINNPLIIKGLIVDILLYILLAYIIDVIISMMERANKIRLRKQEGVVPKVYKPKRVSVADKVVKKVILKE